MEEPRLPPGYRLNRSDPDMRTLRRTEGWIVAYFNAGGASKEVIEEAAWDDYRGEEDH